MIDIFTLLLVTLLPVAAGTGWLARDRLAKKTQNRYSNQLSHSYFKGINFLLNEQPDKALEEFLKIANLNTNTVEVHLALGNLFRKRGEVDRAIRIHQNIIARDTLTNMQRLNSLAELAEDYMSAGLLDRAEKLYKKVIASHNQNTQRALYKLLMIYQQEKDWLAAISIAKQLEKQYAVDLNNMVGHFYCELAETSLYGNDTPAAIKMINMALKHYSNCTRAYIILGDLNKKNKNFTEALSNFKSALSIDINFAPILLDNVIDCYQQLNREGEIDFFLKKMIGQYDGISVSLKYADYLIGSADEEVALSFMNEQLSNRPSIKGLNYIINLKLERSKGNTKKILIILQHHIKKILEDKAIFRCNYCGFSSQAHHWQCPGCKSWDKTKTIYGVTAE